MARAATADFIASGSWRAERRLTLEQARRRSRVIGALRWAFAAGAALAVLSVVASMATHAFGGGYIFEEPIAQSETLTMRAPRFTGRTSDGERFVITAETASRQSPGSDLVDLAQPRMETQTGRIITAERGVYHITDRSIELAGSVNFYEPGGTRLATGLATVKSRQSYAGAETPVVVSGPLGEVRANAYEIEDGRILLEGAVRGFIRSEAEQAASEP